MSASVYMFLWSVDRSRTVTYSTRLVSSLLNNWINDELFTWEIELILVPSIGLSAMCGSYVSVLTNAD